MGPAFRGFVYKDFYFEIYHLKFYKGSRTLLTLRRRGTTWYCAGLEQTFLEKV